MSVQKLNAGSKEIRHFLDLDKLPAETLRRIIETAKAVKAGRFPNGDPKPFAGKALAMIFEKPSTRTRVSFELGMKKLGGDAVVLERESSQLGRGETVADTARVLSRYVDCIMVRTTKESKLMELADNAGVPVINGLTDRTHPCQLMADVMTFEEHRGPIKGRRITWSGDGNNMATSWIQAAVMFDFELNIACPGNLAPPPDVLAWAKAKGGKVKIVPEPAEAVKGADCVVTDTWVSMGDADTLDRTEQLRRFQVDETLMAKANKDAIFMHCLPAHRGDEMTAAVIDGPRSVVWDEAENRLHAQQGILYWCFGLI